MEDEQFNTLVELIKGTEESLNKRMDKQYNTLTEKIEETNEKMDKQYDTLVELIKGTEERLNKRIDENNKRIDENNKKIEKTNETLKRHAEEMERRFENMNNMLIATDQTNKMYLAALNKEDERLEAVMLEVKKESEERDKMLDERLKVANL